MSYYVMMEMHCPDHPPYKVMYPFETEKELVEFKEGVNGIFYGTYCDDCERVDLEDLSEINEGYE